MGIITSKYFLKTKRKVQCLLCPHMCQIHEGKYGICGVRANLGGKIKTRNYGVISGIAIDPIEKKPLYHFFPGSRILSVGSWGCNFKCNFCQNWQISQNSENNVQSGKEMLPPEIVNKALEIEDNIGVAFTYNEPIVWYEFMLDTARLVKEKGLYNVMVSNGYINEDPLIELLNYIDAFNIDLKAFSDSFYKEMTKGGLKYVLDAIKTIKAHKKHIELTNLIIPGKNDNTEQFILMVEWIANELGDETVLHISRYFPRYKQVILPANIEKLNELYHIAKRYLKYVYIGNVENENYTICSNCGVELIRRSVYEINILSNYNEGKCGCCGNLVIENSSLQ